MMRTVNSLLMKTTRMGVMRDASMQTIRKGLIGRGTGTGTGIATTTSHRFVHDTNHMRKASTLQSMREFFMHPLTWDRNNGYLNVVLALAIFSFCFINSCASCPEEGPQTKTKKSD